MAQAGQIPERDVDRTGRARLGAGAVEAEIGRVEGSRDELDAPESLADQPGAHLVVDDAFDGIRTPEGLAEAGEALVGFDLPR